MPTTKGSRWFAGGPPKTADSLHVGRLRAAGAIPIGKTAAPEFGAWAYTASPLLGVTRNPWDPAARPAAPAAGRARRCRWGWCPFCTASDGGGSIRTPAAFTGLVGLRASYGRIPTFGDTHLAQNAVVGSLTTTVADTALLLDVMAGPDARDRTCLPTAAGALPRRARAARPVGPAGRLVGRPRLRRRRPRGRVDRARPAARAFVRGHGSRARRDRPSRFEDYTLTYAFMEGVDKFVGIDPDLWEQPPRRARPAVGGGLEATSAGRRCRGRPTWRSTGAGSSTRSPRSTTTSTSSSRRWRRSRRSRPRDRCPPRSAARRSTAACPWCSASSPAS